MYWILLQLLGNQFYFSSYCSLFSTHSCLKERARRCHEGLAQEVGIQPNPCCGDIDGLRNIGRRLTGAHALQIYPIKEKGSRTRLALIICNTVFDHLSPRLGAERDIAEMKMLLESLDYTVHIEEQLTAKVRVFPYPSANRSSTPDFLPQKNPATPTLFYSIGYMQTCVGVVTKKNNNMLPKYLLCSNMRNLGSRNFWSQEHLGEACPGPHASPDTGEGKEVNDLGTS